MRRRYSSRAVLPTPRSLVSGRNRYTSAKVLILSLNQLDRP
jgi:hypothetical protein